MTGGLGGEEREKSAEYAVLVGQSENHAAVDQAADVDFSRVPPLQSPGQGPGILFQAGGRPAPGQAGLLPDFPVAGQQTGLPVWLVVVKP